MTVNELTAIDHQIEALIGDVNNLPTPPLVFAQISRVINDENTSAYDIAAILAEDPAMSAKVLKISNSAYYGLTNPVPTVKQAIVVLGMNEVKNVVLSASALGAFKGIGRDHEFEDEFWRHSLAAAVASRILIRARRVKQYLEAETGFSSGLLHDIGKIVILCYAVEKHREVRELLKKQPMPDRLAEKEVMGIDHNEVGVYLGRRWNLPGEILEAIGFHHEPQLAKDHPIYAAVTHLANYLATATFAVNKHDTEGLPPLDPEVMSRLGVAEDDFKQLLVIVNEEYARSETFLRMAVG